MEQKQLNELKQKLEELRKEIQKVIAFEDEKSGSRDVVDEVDLATDMITEMMGSALSSSNVKNLKLIDEALERINNGEYGKCDECGEDIPFKRLEYKPFASYCVSCKELLEKDGLA